MFGSAEKFYQRLRIAGGDMTKKIVIAPITWRFADIFYLFGVIRCGETNKPNWGAMFVRSRGRPHRYVSKDAG